MNKLVILAKFKLIKIQMALSEILIFKKLKKFSIYKIIIALLPIFILYFLMFGIHSPSFKIPSVDSVQINHRVSDKWITDFNAKKIDLLRTDHKIRSLPWVPYSQISPVFQEYLLKAEDKNFYKHHGVDYLAIMHSLWQNLTHSSHRGASTITMQLATLLGGNESHFAVVKKIKQILMAYQIERTWKKQDILEAYLNSVPFRHDIIGLPAASQGFFSKDPYSLTQYESAALVVLLRAPNASPQKVIQRICRIFSNESCSQIETLLNPQWLEHFQILRERDILPVLPNEIVVALKENEIRTSLDFNIQKIAMEALREQLTLLKQQNVKDGAIIVLDNQTDRIVAYVANAGRGWTDNIEVDGVKSKRQLGSTLKPFVYATALDLNLIHSNSLVDDSKIDIAIGQNKIYHPQNYDHQFHGLVPIAQALASSLNVPAVRMLQLAGGDRVLANLLKVGFTKLELEDYYGPSLALGTIDASLKELTEAYRRLAIIEDSTFSTHTKKEIFNILADPQNRTLTFGLDNILELPFLAAVKTGTSKDMRDNWCIGYTPQYTVGVWVGNFNGQPMWNVSGVSGAAPIWRKLMIYLHPNANFQKQEESIPQQSVLMQFKNEKPVHTISSVRYPVHDMIIAVDPDIPLQNQMVPIEIEFPQPGEQLYIDQKKLNSPNKIQFWQPQKGKHHLKLISTRGQLVQDISFEVR